MEDEVRSVLREMYESDREPLERLLGRSLPWG